MTSSSSLYGSTPQTGNISSSNLTTLYSGNATPVANGNLVVPGTLTVNGCAILTNCSSFSLLPTNAETILFGGQATSMSIGASSGVTTINNQLATANYTFPVADGVNGQVLVTDGAGTISFAAASTVGKTYSIDASTTTGGANFNLVSSDPTTDTIKFAEGSGMSIVRTDANTITFSNTSPGTTYTQDASSTTGGANLNLRGSDSSVDPVKFASGTNITVTATDANTITISTTADNIPDGTARGQVLYWDGSAWTASSNIRSSASANRLISTYENSTAGTNNAMFLRKDYGATAYSSANNDGVGLGYGITSDGQGLSSYGVVSFEYSATAPQFVVASSLDNFATAGTPILIVDSTEAAVAGNLDVRGGNITNTTGDLSISPDTGNALDLSTDGLTPTTITRNTNTTNANVRSLALDVQSSGTPTVGFGNSIEFNLETAPSVTTSAGYISVTSTDLTSGSEDFKISFGLMENGATTAEKAYLDSAGNFYADARLSATAVDLRNVSNNITASMDVTGPFTTSATTPNQAVAVVADAATYRSVKFQVQVTSGTAYQALEIMVIHDGTTAYLNTYGDVRTGANLSTFDADISGGNIRLLATPVNAVTVYNTLVSAIAV